MLIMLRQNKIYYFSQLKNCLLFVFKTLYSSYIVFCCFYGNKGFYFE